MNRFKLLKCFLIATLGILFFSKTAHADMVFPAIAHQFMIISVIPSYWPIVMAALILIVEAFFIKKLLSISFILSLINSFAINLISSIAGIFITNVFSSGIFAYDNMRAGTYLGLIPGYILTVLLEAALLFLITLLIKQKLKVDSLIKTTMTMNFFSYLIILLGMIIADIITKGANFSTY